MSYGQSAPRVERTARRPAGLRRALWATLLVLTTLLWAGCGGCPWTRVSAVTITPRTPCLKLAGAQGQGGCVDPELRGTNNCAEPLVILIPGAQPAEYRFEPGQAVVLVVRLGLGQYNHNTYTFELPARLGEKDLEISFQTSRDGSSPLGCLSSSLLVGLALLGALCVVLVAIVRAIASIAGDARNS